MRRSMFYTLFLLLVCIYGAVGRVMATNLDGRTILKYLPANVVIHKTPETAQGFVRFNDGLTITQDGHGKLDTCISFSGSIDLRETGTLELLGDLKLDSHVTFSSGGNIKGRNNTILLGGDLTIPAGKIIHFTGDTIIDGNGNTLFLNEHAQLFIDTDITLTLRNLSIITTRNSLTNPAIRCAASKSKLALDNVMLAPCGDFLFREGQFFIHNDVVFTGTSSFIYTSTRPSYITSHACLGFDLGTTFSFAPATNSNEQLVFSDATSNLYLNGCSLLSTGTGMRLTKGLVLFDNKVTCNSYASCDIATPTPAALVGDYVSTGTGAPLSVAWAPSSNFVTVTSYYSNALQVYKFNGTSKPEQVGTDVYVLTYPRSVSWSPDGKFLAVVNNNGHALLHIYSFDGINTPVEVGTGASTGSGPQSVSWSPDGKFLSVVNYSGGTLQIYSFNGISTPKIVGGTVSAGSNPLIVSWAPDGRFLAVVSVTSKELQIYSFNGTSTPTKVHTPAVTTGDDPQSVAWAPNGNFLAIVHTGSVSGTKDKLQIYSFNGIDAPATVGDHVDATSPLSVSWSPDGRFLAVTGTYLQMYTFNGTDTPTAVGSITTGISSAFMVSWSPDGKYIAEVNFGNKKLGVFSVNYINPRVTQPISQGIVFGKNSAGEAYDCGVKLLSGARVDVIGKISHDPA